MKHNGQKSYKIEIVLFYDNRPKSELIVCVCTKRHLACLCIRH